MDTISPSSPSPPPALVRAIRHAIKPFVRLMLASGLTYPLFAELLKGLFVEIAERDFRIGGQSPSDSRISLVSGVHRKDVRRLRSAERPPDQVMPEAVSFGAKLVTTWLTDARFLDADGAPRPLARSSSAGEPASFEELVAGRSTDIRPRVVLDEWLRLGIVRVGEGDRLVLNTDAFVPQAGLEEKLFFFSHNLHAHAAAATDNLLGARAAQLERSLIFEGMTEEGVREVEARARQLGSRVLKDLDRLAIERQASEAGSGAPRFRITAGVYFHREPLPAERIPGAKA